MERPEIVILTPHLPFPGVGHAGGEYLRRHIQALDWARVTLVTLDSSQRVHTTQVVGAEVIVHDASGTGRMSRFLDTMARAALPWRPRGYRRSVLRDSAVSVTLERADIVEVHWPEYGSLVTAIRERRPSATVVYYPHDVLSQRFRRRIQASRSAARRVHALAVLAPTIFAERWIVGCADMTYVFSEKDAELYSSRLRARVGVVLPPLGDDRASFDDSERTDLSVIFSGAFDREVNAEAALYILHRVWPRVKARSPEARLRLVGQSPTEAMRSAAYGDPSIVITGRVDSLDPYYARSRVMLAALLGGAGVKFKCIDAVLHGVAVVGTPIAAEGLPSEWFDCITDDPDEMAERTVAAMCEFDTTRDSREAAARRARALYSPSSYYEKLRREYEALMGRGEVRGLAP